MKTDKLYKAVTIVSMVTMPAAAAINFGDAAFDALNGRTKVKNCNEFMGGLESLNFRPYGFTSLSLDHEALDGGMAGVKSASGLFADGRKMACCRETPK